MLLFVLRWYLGFICCLVVGAVAAEQQDNQVVLAPGYGVLDFTPPAVGDYQLPVIEPATDHTVVLASGEPSTLFDQFDGKIVLLSFIYLSCNEVNGCPLATHVLLKTLRSLPPTLASALSVISVSFDPTNDRPEVLSAYSRSLTEAFPQWLFATTASEQQLQPILADYGQNRIVDINESGRAVGTFSHNLRVFLIDRKRQIRNIYSVSFLHPEILANDIQTLLDAVDVDDTPVTTPLTVATGPGDFKGGYESDDYITRSQTLAARRGQSVDLLTFAKQPPLGLPVLPELAETPLTSAKVQLGRKLFFDRRLSLNNTLSCAMCHIPEQGFTNNELATAIGFEGRTVRRNTPTLFNVAYSKRLFHDGRESRLEQQAWQPLLARNEMANPSIGSVLDKIERIPDYQGLFEAAFPKRGVSMMTVGLALASYQRTLNAADSPFDRWYYGKDESAISASAKRGFNVFTGKGRCVGCHTVGRDSALFSDNRLHNTGIGWRHSMRKEPLVRQVQVAPGVFVDVSTALINKAAEPLPNDLGLYEVTQNPADRWRYKTPTLRNIALTAPYMHNGELTTLEEVVSFYNRGGYQHELLDPMLQPLALSEREMTELVAFLQTLTGSNVETLIGDAFAAPVGDLSASDPHWSHDNRIEY